MRLSASAIVENCMVSSTVEVPVEISLSFSFFIVVRILCRSFLICASCCSRVVMRDSLEPMNQLIPTTAMKATTVIYVLQDFIGLITAVYDIQYGIWFAPLLHQW